MPFVREVVFRKLGTEPKDLGEAATFIPNSSFLIYVKLSSPIKGRYTLRANPLILSSLNFFSFSCYNVKKV